MAFKEKIAWLTLAAMAVAYSIYFGIVIAHVQSGQVPTLMQTIWWFGSVTGTQLIVVIIASIVLAATAAREANAPADERDRAISRRATGWSYYLLLSGAVLTGVVMPFSEPAWKIINTTLLVIVLAEAVRQIVIIASYRRGWHG